MTDTVLYMILFGVGTVPMMMILPLFGNSLLLKVKNKFNYRIAVLLVASLLILRGLNLGIPYLSPAVHNIDADVEAVDLRNCN
jgi:sulfite exporter TauE/SafE